LREQATAQYKKFKPKQLSDEEIAKIKAKREPEEGWEEAKNEAEGKKKGQDSVFALIRAKQANREGAFDSMIAAMEAKYAGKEQGAKGKKSKTSRR
jgi:hypothetical protein